MMPWRKWLGFLAPKRALRLPDPAGDLPPSLGEEGRVYAIGDIHGRLDLLNDLLEMIEQDKAARPPATCSIILLGDLLNRGPASRQVIETVMRMCRTGGETRCLKGNHEEVFVLSARGDMRAVPVLRRMEGGSTLASYGLDEALFAQMSDRDIIGWMQANIPRDHIEFLDALGDTIVMGDYLFVHAGIRPDVPLDEQQGADMRWIRDEFLSSRRHHPKMIVHGHSISEDVDERPNRIGIDTGAYRSGRLTAIGLERTDRWFLQTA